MTTQKFRAIIVGGGPVGLTAANALDRAGIDYILLERRPEVVIDAGSNLVLMPMGLRALDQLGLHASIESVSSALAGIDRFDHTGRNIGDVRWFVNMKSSYGIAPRVISRHSLTKVLHAGLGNEAQQKIYTNKSVASITSTPTGVLVTCTDDSCYSGSIVIAADGAHSKVRDLMRSMAITAQSPNINLEKPFLTTYRALWVRFPLMKGLKPGMSCETHGPNAATQLFAGHNSAVIGLYERLDEPTRERQRYTLDDQTALIERWGHLPLTAGASLTVRDVYSAKLEAGLVSLEEGVVDHWSWNGRIVLVGDAAHKFTPSTGSGCNNGIIDIAALTNELQVVIKQAQFQSGDSNAIPSTQMLESAFQNYQMSRHEVVRSAHEGSSRATASATWQTGIHKFLDRRVFSSHTLQKILIRSAAGEMERTPKFDFSHHIQLPTTSLITV